jgi:hypothetical protein
MRQSQGLERSKKEINIKKNKKRKMKAKNKRKK